jgi:acyl-CoA reductase-like NAD-dependent aldehyde dehydrogenase
MIHQELLINGVFIGGPCDSSVGKQVVRAPFDGSIVGSAAEAGLSEGKTAIESAHEAFQTWRNSPRHVRQKLLREVARLVRARQNELVDLLSREVGKPVTWSKGEVGRLAITFDLAADALSSYGPEALPVDFDPRGEGYQCLVERFPIGVIFCIVPYNWPYNLAAHKLAPALATGNTVVLKPSGQAPLSTLLLARIVQEAGCPPGVLNAVNCPGAVAEKLAQDERVKMLSFTGSPAVGWKLKGLLPEKRVSLELGGNASAIVCPDADLDWTIPRIVAGGYGYAGQICIAIQHVLAHRSIYDQVRERLIEGTNSCPTGDPMLPETVCGPLISEDAAEKVEKWIQEAVDMGATVLAGGGREGAVVQPTLVEGVPGSAKLSCQEVFGPVLTIEPYGDFDEALARVNSSDYGIQCGVFTHDLRVAERAFRELEVGGVVVNDYPTLRFDNMPYGGVKRSGFGREGIRYAMDEMTEPKVMLSRLV